MIHGRGILLTAALCAALDVTDAAPAQDPVRTKISEEAQQITALIANLQDEAKAPAAEFGLLRIGTRTVPELMRVVLEDGQAVATPQSKRALVVLGRLGPRAPVFGELLEALGSCTEDVYFEWLRALADLVPYSEYQGDPRLIERLVMTNRNASRRIAQSNDRQRFQYEFNRLQQRSQVDPRVGRDALIEEVGRNRTHRREVAAEVLGRLGKSAKSAIPALAKALRKGAPVVGQIGGFSVPKYRDGYPRAASEAMIAIAPRDPRTSIAWGWLIENSPREDVRWTAALRIGSFGAQAEEQVDSLVEALRDPSPRVRQEAITALGMVGPGAKRATFTLQQLADGDDKASAARARAALRLIHPKSK